MRRKTVPVGRANEHEDENGDAPTASCVIRVFRAMVNGCSSDGYVAGVSTSGRASADVSALNMRLHEIPNAPTPAHSIELPITKSPSPFGCRLIPVRDSNVSVPKGITNVSPPDLGGNNVLETLVRTSPLRSIRPYGSIGAYSLLGLCMFNPSARLHHAVVRVATVHLEANRHQATPTIAELRSASPGTSVLATTRRTSITARGVNVRRNLDGTRDRRTCATAGLLLHLGTNPATFLLSVGVQVSASDDLVASRFHDALTSSLLILLRAETDAGAGIYDGVIGSRVSGA